MATRTTLVLLVVLASGCGAAPSAGSDASTAADVSTAADASGGVDASALFDDAAAPDAEANDSDASSSSSDVGSPLDAGAPDSGPSCPTGYPLTRWGGKFLVQVKFNGYGPFTLMWDTGAPTSVFDLGIENKVGTPPYVISVGGKRIVFSTKIGSYDLRGEGYPVDGVIGTDVLQQVAVTADPQRQVFWVEGTPDTAALAACSHVEGKPVTLDLTENHYFFVKGKVEGADGWFALDTGASFGFVTETAFTTLQTAHDRPAIQGFYTPAVGGTFWAKLSTLGSIELGGWKVDHLALRTGPDNYILGAPSDGVPFIGVAPTGFVEHFLFTVDYGAKQLRLDGYKNDPRRGPTWYAMGIGLQESTDVPTLVGQVLPGSSAETAGVQVGDELVSVGGISIDGLDPASRPWAVVSENPHQGIAVVIQRAGAKQSLSIDLGDILTDPVLQ
jgi:predicted aspartyl protease